MDDQKLMKLVHLETVGSLCLSEKEEGMRMGGSECQCSALET